MKARLIRPGDQEYPKTKISLVDIIKIGELSSCDFLTLPSIGFNIFHPEADDKFKDFVHVCPGDKEETMKQARRYNTKLPMLLIKGTYLIFDYPLRNPALYRLTEDIIWSEDFIEVFCDCYIDIYQIEEETQVYDDLARKQIKPGIFNIYGHDLGDLVLEKVVLDKVYCPEYLSEDTFLCFGVGS